MKILLIYKSLALSAGTERVSTDKANYLASKNGHEINIITYEQGEHPIIFPLHHSIKHSDTTTPFFKLSGMGLTKRAIEYFKMKKKIKRKLKKHIESFKPDIIICTTYSYPLITLIIKLCNNIPLIIESHVAKKETGYGFHHNIVIQLIAKQLQKKAEKAIKKSSALVVLTDKDAKEWLPVKKAVVIPNILTHYPQKIADTNKKKNIISIGRLTEQKGFDLLLKAWHLIANIHPEWKLTIYGSGSQKEELEEMIVQLNLTDSVNLNEPTLNIYAKYMESEIYVMSSRYEGFGLVLIEAMSCGLPCISFDCPYGPSDIIKNGEDGFLVKNGNINQLAQKITYLIENNDIRDAMGKQARINVKRYLPEKIMNKWEELFHSLIKN